MKKIIAMLLTLVLTVSLAGCGSEDANPGDGRGKNKKNKAEGTVNLTEGISAGTSEAKAIDDAFRTAYTEFAAGLFREARKNGAEFLSPYSAYEALAMVLNGAEGQTLSDMEKVFGLSVDELNLYLKTMAERYNDGESVTITDSVWVSEGFRESVQKAFLEKVVSVYRASVFAADFSDPGTVGEMNRWVEENTKNRIHELMSHLDPMTVMVLINCLTFDGKWSDPFKEGATSEELFTKQSGEAVTVSMMNGQAEGYFETERYIGFDKYYENGFLFRAYLPKKGITATELAEGLTSEMLLNPGDYDGKCYVKLPKITFESGAVDLIPALNALGMGSAFTPGANFGKIGDQLLISEVIQKTFIEVDEEGTKAAAATEVSLRCYAAAPEVISHYVYLDQPFLYTIYDFETGIPLFVGICE